MESEPGTFALTEVDIQGPRDVELATKVRAVVRAKQKRARVRKQQREKEAEEAKAAKKHARRAARAGQQRAAAGEEDLNPENEPLCDADILEKLVQVPDISDLTHLPELDRHVSSHMNSTSEDTKAKGLMLLRAIARENPSAMLSRGYLDHVWSWLHSRHKLLRPCAAAVLAALASHKIGKEALLRKRDLMPRLVAMMRCGAESLDAQYASLVVANWTLHPACKELIGRVGGIPVLVSLLKQAISRPTPPQLAFLMRIQGLVGDDLDGLSDDSLSDEGQSPAGSPKAVKSQHSKHRSSSIKPTLNPYLETSEHKRRNSQHRLQDAGVSDDPMWVRPLPASVNAVTAMLHVVDHERNKRFMLQAELPVVVAQALSCPHSNALVNRCQLLSAWLGMASVRQAAIQHHATLTRSTVGATNTTSHQPHTPMDLEAHEAAEVAVQLGGLLHLEDDEQKRLQKEMRRRKRRMQKLQSIYMSSAASSVHQHANLPPLQVGDEHEGGEEDSPEAGGAGLTLDASPGLRSPGSKGTHGALAALRAASMRKPDKATLPKLASPKPKEPGTGDKISTTVALPSLC